MSATDGPPSNRRSNVIWAVVLTVALVVGAVVAVDRLTDEDYSGKRPPAVVRTLAGLEPGDTFSMVQALDHENPYDPKISGSVTFLGLLTQRSPNLDYLGANVALAPAAEEVPGALRRGFTPAAAGRTDTVFLPAAANLMKRRADVRLRIPNDRRAVIVAGFRLREGDHGGVNGMFADYRGTDSEGRAALGEAAVICGPAAGCPPTGRTGDVDAEREAVAALDDLGLLGRPLPDWNASAIEKLPIVR